MNDRLTFPELPEDETEIEERRILAVIRDREQARDQTETVRRFIDRRR